METALARIRILVANQPLLMRESVTCTVADQDDVEIVGQAEDVAEIPSLVEQTAARLRGHFSENRGSDPSFATPFWDCTGYQNPSSHSGKQQRLSVLEFARDSLELRRGSAEGILSALRGKIESKES